MTKVLQRPTLILNRNWQPVNVATVARALASVIGGWIGKAVRVAVVALAAFMALDQLGIARNVVMTTFVAVLGTVALAAVIAFGIDKDLPRNID